MSTTNNSRIHGEILSVKDWIITFLLTAIPTVGLVFLFIWAFGDSVPLAKKNWARAQLIFLAITIASVIIIYVFTFLAIFALTGALHSII